MLVDVGDASATLHCLIHLHQCRWLLCAQDVSTRPGEGRIPMVQLGTGQEHTVPLYDKKGQTTGELRFRAQEEQVRLCSCYPLHCCLSACFTPCVAAVITFAVLSLIHSPVLLDSMAEPVMPLAMAMCVVRRAGSLAARQDSRAWVQAPRQALQVQPLLVQVPPVSWAAMTATRTKPHSGRR
jgi:hypothetical protein